MSKDNTTPAFRLVRAPVDIPGFQLVQHRNGKYASIIDGSANFVLGRSNVITVLPFDESRRSSYLTAFDEATAAKRLQDKRAQEQAIKLSGRKRAEGN
jgi:hypothetical protein